MKQVSAILGKILEIAKDAKTWLRVLILVIVGFGGAILFSKTKVKKEDCMACNTERRELINALIGIKKDLGAALNTSYMEVQDGLIWASYDTIPKRTNQAQQAQQVRRVMSKIDSILWKLHIDSINRTKN